MTCKKTEEDGKRGKSFDTPSNLDLPRHMPSFKLSEVCLHGVLQAEDRGRGSRLQRHSADFYQNLFVFCRFMMVFQNISDNSHAGFVVFESLQVLQLPFRVSYGCAVLQSPTMLVTSVSCLYESGSLFPDYLLESVQLKLF